jgi:hypothetical protein
MHTKFRQETSLKRKLGIWKRYDCNTEMVLTETGCGGRQVVAVLTKYNFIKMKYSSTHS